MTVLHPCHNCHRKTDCSIRTDALAKMKGGAPKVTKATISCKIPQQDFPPGSIVDVEAFELVEDGGYGEPNYSPQKITVRAIVRAWRNRKACVVIEKGDEITQPEQGAIGYLTVNSEKLTATGLPPVELCKCGLSQERCENRNYPSVRGGEWRCQVEIQEREDAELAARGYW